MIQLTDIAFAYEPGGFTLHVPSLSIDTGQRVAVVGPSGSGKTTLLNLIAGILVPGRGTVEVDGQRVSSLGDAARRRLRLSRIGLVFQSVELIDYLSVRDNVLLPYRLSRWLRLDDTARRRADELLDRVGLSKLADRRASRLSQGEQQRVGICRALSAGPGLILADEPTSSLDGDTAASVLDLLMGLANDHGATLMMLTHDRSLLPRFDEIVTVTGGIAAMGPAGQGAAR